MNYMFLIGQRKYESVSFCIIGRKSDIYPERHYTLNLGRAAQ